MAYWTPLVLLMLLVVLGDTATVSDDDFFGITTQPPVSYTFADRSACNEICEHLCTPTIVYFDMKNLEMYNCLKMKPPKTSVINSLRSNSFYMTLVVLGGLTLAVLVLMSIVFVCGLVCTQRGTNRAGNDRYLNYAGDGEFREYLQGKTDSKETPSPKKMSRGANGTSNSGTSSTSGRKYVQEV